MSKRLKINMLWMDVWNFGYRYRVSTLSKASLNVIGIIMQSLKSIGQYKLWGAVKFTYHCPLPPCIGLLLAECLNSPRFPGSISHMHFQTHFHPLSIYLLLPSLSHLPSPPLSVSPSSIFSISLSFSRSLWYCRLRVKGLFTFCLDAGIVLIIIYLIFTLP